jgi:hypothetical protein
LGPELILWCDPKFGLCIEYAYLWNIKFPTPVIETAAQFRAKPASGLYSAGGGAHC